MSGPGAVPSIGPAREAHLTSYPTSVRRLLTRKQGGDSMRSMSESLGSISVREPEASFARPDNLKYVSGRVPSGLSTSQLQGQAPAGNAGTLSPTEKASATGLAGVPGSAQSRQLASRGAASQLSIQASSTGILQLQQENSRQTDMILGLQRRLAEVQNTKDVEAKNFEATLGELRVELMKTKQERDEAHDKLALLDKEISAARQGFEKDASASQEEIAKLRGMLDQKEKAEQSLHEEVDRLRSENIRLDSASKRSGEDFFSLQNSKRDIELRLNKVSAENEEQSSLIKKLQAELLDAQSSFKQQLERFNEQANNAAEKANSLQNENYNLNERVNSLNAEKARLEDSLASRNNELQLQLDDLKFANEKLKKQIEKERAKNTEQEAFYTKKIDEILATNSGKQKDATNSSDRSRVEEDQDHDSESSGGLQTLQYYQDTLAASEAMVESLRKELESTNASFKAQLETHQRITKVKTNELETLLEQAKHRSDDLQQKVREVTQQYLDIKKENNVLRHNSEVAESKCEALRHKSSSQIDDLTKQVTKLTDANKELKSQCEALNLQATTDNLNSQHMYEALAREHEDLKTQYEMLKDTTEQSNSMLEKRLEEKETEIADVNIQLEEAHQEIEKLSAELQQFNSNKKHIEDIEIRNYDLENELNDLHTQLDNTKEENIKLQTDVEKLQATADESKALNSINESLKRQLDKASERLDSLDSQLKQVLEERSNRIEQHNQQTAQLTEEYKRIQAELQDVSDRYAAEAQTNAKLQIRLKHFEDRYSEIIALFGISDGDNEQDGKGTPSIASSISDLKAHVAELESSLSVSENALRISKANELGLKEQIATARQRLATAEADRDALRIKYTKKRQKCSAAKETVEQLTHELESLTERTSNSQKLEQSKERSAKERRAREAETYKIELDQLRKRTKEADAEISDLRKQISLITVECEEKVAQIESSSKLQAGELQNTVFHLRNELDQKQQDIQELKDNVAHQQELRKMAENASREVRDQLEKALSEKERLTALTDEQEKTISNKEADSSERIQALIAEVDKLKDYNASLRSTCNEFQSSNELLEGENSALTSRCNSLMDQINAIQVELSRLTNKNERLKSKRDEIKLELEAKIHDLLNDLNTAQSTVQILDSKLNDINNSSDVNVEKLKTMANEIVSLRTQLSEQDNHVRILEQANEELQVSRDNMEKSLRNEIENLRMAYENAENKVSSYEKQISSLSTEVKKRAKEISSGTEKANILSQKVLELERTLEDARANHESQVTQCRQLVADLKEDARIKHERCMTLETEIDRLSAENANQAVLVELENKKNSAAVMSAKRQVEALNEQLNECITTNDKYKSQLKSAQEIIQLLQKKVDDSVSANNFSGSRAAYQQLAALKEENMALRSSLENALNNMVTDERVWQPPTPIANEDNGEREENEALVLDLNSKVLFLEAELSALEKRLKESRDQQEIDLEKLRQTVSEMINDRRSKGSIPNQDQASAEAELRTLVSVLETDIKNKEKKLESVEIQLKRMETLGDPFRLTEQLKEEQAQRRNETETFQRELVDIRQRVERETNAYKAQISTLQRDLMETRAQLNYFRRRSDSSASAVNNSSLAFSNANNSVGGIPSMGATTLTSRNPSFSTVSNTHMP